MFEPFKYQVLVYLKDALCQVWLKIAQVDLENKIFKISSIYLAILLIPLGKGDGPSFIQSWIPLNQVCFVQSLVLIGLAPLEKIFKIR